MEYARKLDSLPQQEQAVTPLRLTVVQPSVWARTKARETWALTTEALAEIVLTIATILLTTGMFVSLAHGLAHYTIIPWP